MVSRSSRPAGFHRQAISPLPRGRSILVLHRNEELHDRLRRVTQVEAQIRFVESWGELRAEVASISPATVVVVDPYFENGHHAPSRKLRNMLASFPSLTVLAAMEPGRGDLAHVVTLAEWGVIDVIDLEEEMSEPALLRRIRNARARPLTALFRGESTAPLTGRSRVILESALEVAMEGGSASALARSMEMDGSTLRRWCAASHLPSPQTLIGWMKALQAGMLLDDPAHTVLSVALACGYGSDQALRRVLRRAVPMTPGELREAGAFQTIRQAFVEEVIERSAAAAA